MFFQLCLCSARCFYVVLQPAACATLPNMNELKGIPRGFLLLVTE